MKLAIKADGIDQAVDYFGAAPNQVRAAMRRAVAKTGRSLRTQVRRDLAAWLGVTQKVIRSRLALRVRRAEGGSATVWIGLNPVPVDLRRFGRQLRQNPVGVQTRKFFFPHAFVATMQSGHTGAFQRTGKFGVMRSGRYQGRVRERIRQVLIPLERPEILSMIASNAHAAKARLEKAFAQELNYEVHVKGR